MGTLIEQLMLCVRTEGIRCRLFATTIQARPDLLRRVGEMQKAGSIREVSPLKNSIVFLTGSASLPTAFNVVHVVSDQLLRVYDPQDRRTKEALPITACLSTQKARMETKGMPRSEQQGAGRPASNGAALQLD
ncbi:hypothetical protein PI124_g10394 [Phytophthora idaei]|nr:hypothetical protein PI126_g5994 [Phytophthora idaei]KAG3244821.1 hypothetical protein PI124_g10394 [Phytophthora idaei]